MALPVGAGAAAYLMTERHARRLLLRPQPYVAAGLALMIFAPVLGWNAAHGWVSFGFQGGRAAGSKWHPLGPLTALAGQALFFCPWIWLPLAACLWRATRSGPAEARQWFLVCLSLPTVALFTLVAFRAHVLFHWAAPGTMLALPLLGDGIARLPRRSTLARTVLAATAVTLVLGALLVATEVRFNWMAHRVENFAPGADPDLDAVEWDGLRLELARRGALGPDAVVAATRWMDAGKIDYALHGAVPVICLGDDPREYGLADPAWRYAGRDLLIVAPRATLAQMQAQLGTMFEQLTEAEPVLIRHAGQPALMLHVFIGRGFKPSR